MPESNDSTGKTVALVAYVVIKVAAAAPVVAVGGGIAAGTLYLISRW